MAHQIFQMNTGKPFYLKDVDRLFYACCFLNSQEAFLMEKEKFFDAMNSRKIVEYKFAVSL